MNRPTFVTMSTLVFTIVAYVTLAQAAHAGGIGSGDVPSSGAYPEGRPAAYNHGNAACLITPLVR